MAVVATINTNFTATTGELEKGTKRVTKAVQQTVSGITAGTFANISSAIGAVRGLVAFQVGKSLVGAIASGLKSLDIGEAARNLGLAPDSLQSLSFAADQSGSSAAALQTALAKMSDTISDAANGGEESQKAFKRLGLDFEKLRTQDVETNFLQIADAMSKASDATARVGAARDIFGRGGVSLITTLSDGAQGIRNLQQQFHRLHGTVGELGFASVDMANDALQRVGVALTGVKNQMLVSAAPGLVLIAEAFANVTMATKNATDAQFSYSKALFGFSKKAGDWIQRFIDPHFDNGVKASQLLQQDWNRIIADMNAVKQRSQQLRDAAGKAGEGGDAASKSKKDIEPAAAERGSKEAFDIIAKSISASQKTDAIPKEQLAVAKRQEHTLEEIERRLNDPKLVLAESNL